jgi:TP901 family phage tail tape measure protein
VALPQVGLDAVIGNLNKFESGAKVITNAYDDIDKKGNTVAGSTVALGNNLLKLGGIAAGAALAGVVALGAAITGFAVTGISKAIDLDQRMANIAATAGVTKEQVGGLKDLIFDLSLNPNLVVNTNQAADAIEVLLANGAKLTDEFGNVTAAGKELATQVVAMSNATGGDFALSAAIATDATNVFGLGVDELGKVVDGATGVMVASKFGAEDYALALAQAGGVAGQTGVEIEDFNTFIAGTASFFSSGSDAGTSFKTFLNQLTPSTNKAVDAMRELGLFTGLSGGEFDKTTAKINKIDDQIQKLDPTSKNYLIRVRQLTQEQQVLKDSLVQGQNAFFNLDGSMKSGAEITELLHNALSGLTEIQRAEALETIFGADASRTAAAVAGMTRDEFEALGATVNKQGQAMQAAATRVDSLSGAWEIFQGIIEAIQIQVGDAFLPLLRQVTSAFIDLAQQNGPMVVGFFEQIASSISNLILFAQSLFSTFQSGGVGGLVGALGLTPATIELIDKISLTISGLAGALISSLFPALSSFSGGGMLETINSGIEFLNTNFEVFKGAILGVGVALGGAVIAAIIAGIGAAIVALATPITAIILASALLGAAWGGNWGGIQEKTFAVWAVIQPILSQLVTWLGVNIPIAIQALSGFWTNTLLPAMTTVWTFVSGTMFPLWMQLQSFLVEVVGVAITNLSNQWTNVLIPALTAVWDYISINVLPLLISIGEVVNAVVNKAIEASAGLWEKVLLPALMAVGEWINVNLMPTLTAIGEYLTSTFGPMLGTTAGGFDSITTALQSATSFFTGFAESIRNFELPWFLTPGSPTPLELGLTGIAGILNGPLKGAFNTFGQIGANSVKVLSGLLAGEFILSLRTIEETVTRLFTIWPTLIDGVQLKITAMISLLAQLQSRSGTTTSVIISGWSLVNSIIGGVVSKLSSSATSLTTITTNATAASTALKGLGAIVFDSLINRLFTLEEKAGRVEDVFENARDAASGLRNVSFSALQTALNSINSIIEDIIENFEDMVEAAEAAQSAANSATSSSSFAGFGGQAALSAVAGGGNTTSPITTTPVRGAGGNVTNITMQNNFGGNTLGSNMDMAQFDNMVLRSLQRLMA